MAVIKHDEFNERIEMLTVEVMMEVIDIFKETYTERKQNILTAVEDSNPQMLEFEIHALKNDLSQFAANQLSDNTQSLLEKIRENESADFKPDVETIINTIDGYLLPELESWYQQHL